MTVVMAMAAVLGGLGACRLLDARSVFSAPSAHAPPARGWAILVPGLGAALVMAAALLAATARIGPGVASIMVAVLGALAFWGVRRHGACDLPSSPPEPRGAVGPGTWAALALFLAAAWLYPVGSLRLDPGYEFLTQQAPWAVMLADHGPEAVHPLGPEATPARPELAWVLGMVGGDPLLTAQVLAGACQALAFLALFGGLREATGHSLAALLGAGAVFLGTSEGWLVTPTLDAAVVHLLCAGTLAALLSSTGAAAAGAAALLLPAAALVDPSAAWPLALLVPVAAVLPGPAVCRVERQAHLVLGLVTLAAVGALGGPSWRLPEMSLWAWLLVPAVFVARRWSIHAGLLLAAGWLLGSPSLAAGAVFSVAGVFLARAWRDSAPGRWGLRPLSVPWRALVAAAVLFLVFQGFEPAETTMNRRVLLAAQKARASVGEMFVPLPLSSWVARHGGVRGLGAKDVELASEMAVREGDVMLLTPSDDRSGLTVAAVLATLARRPLAGWHADAAAPEFEPAAAALRLDPPGAVVTAPHLAARGHFGGVDVSGVLEAPPSSAPPMEGGAGLTLLVSGRPAPGRPVRLQRLSSQDLRLGYRVTRDGAAWGAHPVEFAPGHPLVFVVPRTPGTYRLQFFARSGDREVPLGDAGLSPFVSSGEVRLEARVEGLPRRLPSRTLVPFVLTLRNAGAGPVDLGRFTGLRVRVEGREAWPDEREGRWQPFEGTVLAPGETVRVEALLPTPLTEGTFRASLALEGPDGLTAPLDPVVEFRTWRRIPAEGAW